MRLKVPIPQNRSIAEAMYQSLRTIVLGAAILTAGCVSAPKGLMILTPAGSMGHPHGGTRSCEFFSGRWRGQWEGTLDAILDAEADASDMVRITYSWGTNEIVRKPGSVFLKGKCIAGSIIIPVPDRGFVTINRIGGSDDVIGVYYDPKQPTPSRIVLSRASSAASTNQ